jgi:arylformamidase
MPEQSITMPVYKKYSQEELDRQYNNRLNAPGFEYHLQQWESVSRVAENKYRLHKDIPYSDLAEEKLDIFPSEKPGSRTLVFIHGGYWHKHSRADFHLVAEAFHRYDITVVLAGYPLMPAFSMDQLVQSCHSAVSWVQRHIHEYNGDPQEVYIAGHSAGGHLTAMAAVADPLHSLHTSIKGICAISGLYDLLPIQLCYVNEILQMDQATALKNSPVHLQPSPGCRILLAVGGNETDEYLAQSRGLFKKWSSPDNPSELLEIKGLDHFSVLTSILDTSSVLHQAIRKLMQV